MSETAALPINTCDRCLQQYWACAWCGASPLGYDPEKPPVQCRNVYCQNTDPAKFRWVTFRWCCVAYNHHVGSLCRHCGNDERHIRVR